MSRVMDGDQPEAGDTPSKALTLAEKIDNCFKTMHPKDRGEWTYVEVSKAMAEQGVKFSPSYLWQLRRGKRDNPTVQQIEALARFFHVPTTYFFGTDEEVETVDAQMVLVQAMRTPQVRDLALRASTLTPQGLRAIAGILKELEGIKGMSTEPGKRRRRPASKPAGEGEPDTGTATPPTKT